MLLDKLDSYLKNKSKKIIKANKLLIKLFDRKEEQ